VIRLPLTGAAAAVLCAAVLPAVDPPPTAAEPVDVLYLADARPVVIRFDVTTDGRPLSAAWEAFVDALFAALDVDKSGKLEPKEVERLRPTVALLSGQAGLPAPIMSVSMTRAELAEHLRRADLPPFRLPGGPDSNVRQRQTRFVRPGSNISSDELDRALLELLDANHDGKLSPAELAAGADVLLRLDADENEMVTPEEVLRRPNASFPFFVSEAENLTPAVDLALLARKGSDPALARRLLTRYGGGPAKVDDPMPGKRRLTREDLKLTPAQFAALDRDGDGALDAEELARFGSAARPDVAITLRFGTRPGVKPVEVTAAGKDPVTATLQGQQVVLEVPGARLDILTPAPAADEAATGFRQAYTARFRNLDQDGNGYLDSKEVANDPLFLGLFAYLDRDGDGKLFEKELEVVLGEVEAVAAAAARATVTTETAETGRGLFGLIDADGDGRLSVREMRAMPKLVEKFDRDRDRLLAPSEVPRRFRVTLTRGQNYTANAFTPFAVLTTPPAAARPAAGPLWFQKMDRNRDGDVSRREFLGTDEQFRRIDTDGDGLISVQEAEAATRAGLVKP
jgi:Ca2+-binding EF-hand superfamily protein